MEGVYHSYAEETRCDFRGLLEEHSVLSMDHFFPGPGEGNCSAVLEQIAFLMMVSVTESGASVSMNWVGCLVGMGSERSLPSSILAGSSSSPFTSVSVRAKNPAIHNPMLKSKACMKRGRDESELPVQTRSKKAKMTAEDKEASEDGEDVEMGDAEEEEDEDELSFDPGRSM